MGPLDSPHNVLKYVVADLQHLGLGYVGVGEGLIR